MPNKMREVARTPSLTATNAQLLYGTVIHIFYTSASSYLLQNCVALKLRDPPFFTIYLLSLERTDEMVILGRKRVA